MMQTFSTDHVPPRDRFELWREERARRMFGVEAEILPEWRPHFTGRMTARAVGPAKLIDVAVTSYTMRRTERAIDRAPDDSFYVRHLVRGRGLTIVGDRAELVGDGALFTGMSDVPYGNAPDPDMPAPGTLCVYRAVKIPLAAVPELSLASMRLASHQHWSASGLNALLRSYLAAFIEQAPRLTGASADLAVRTLAQLAVGARGMTDIREDAAATAIREALLVRAQRLIEQNLLRPDLGPAQVAAWLGVSVRTLHLAFEPSGESFSRYILARRLERADRLLQKDPQMSVTQAAFAAGFESLSTFFRCYRSAYGATPGERRARA
ncbi:helix-turn-helix transcriptional regulator [Methylobacterium sp. NEAU 140]|uniref:AraC family transcriptional regulator n=1 Tax=Methylobacterium sp. NEAU 140 TaxID=3064945 RepID=UPI0027373946|nr:AraC family transcriptional regulator [Methylobacterium sp. NEAU 140]MDP4026456.1 helix-turn-helix transcriptional regulator [Methylobacterium sp. NEAU 140]